MTFDRWACVGLAALALTLGCDDTGEDAADMADPSADMGPLQGDAGPVDDAGPEADRGPVADMGMMGGPVSTASILCGYEGSGMQRLVYENRRRENVTPVDETLPFEFSWVCADGDRTLTANGVPNHGVDGGQFATLLSAQNVSYTVTTDPAVIDEVTTVREPGFALNGVKFDPATAGTCPDDATRDTDCNYAMGNDTWSMVATPGDVSPWRFNFGVDENDAHTQPSGAYHYHGNPVALVAQLNPDAESSMTLIGWARDGFPMYSHYGYSDPDDSTSGVVKMRSSYRTVDEPPADRPSVEDFPLGHFIQDWVYVEGSGDLDECNGRFGATPEFPDGIYHYYITETYPFVQRCVKGTGAPERMRPMGGMGPPQ